jgi:hypothetical protein
MARTVNWWRSWHGAPLDAKWLSIARRADVQATTVMAVAWCLFDHASQASDRGDVSEFDVESVSDFCNVPERVIENILDAMSDKGMIVDGRLSAWDKRQPGSEEETSTERVQKHRAKKRLEAATSVNETDETEVKPLQAFQERSREEERIGEEIESESGADAPKSETAPLAYKGRFVKRVTEKSLKELQAICPHLTRADILTELSRCDEYYSEQEKPPKSSWWTTRAWFERITKRRKEESGVYKPNPALRGVL